MLISVIIPTFNEQTRIGQTLDEICSFLKQEKFNYEIIVVNDGSSDQTIKVVLEKNDPRIRLINLPKNSGKGAAVKAGIMAGQGDLLLFTDADLSTPIIELKKFLQHTADYDIVIASRALKESRIIIHQPWYKEILGRLGNMIIRLVAVPKIYDTQCGFKLFKPSIKKIFVQQRIKRWGFDIEILFLAQKCGLAIKEMPVEWKNDFRTKVGIFSYLATLCELVKIQIYYLFNYYHC